jgi:hypothetical protein
MKHRNAAAVGVAVAVLAAAGTATGLELTAGASAASATSTASAPSTAPAAITAAAAKTPRYVVLDCAGKPAVRPAAYTVTCADDGTGLEHMHWTGWTSHQASGTGFFYQNDCTPDCAAGTVIQYPAKVAFTGSDPVAGHSAERRYTRLKVVFTGRRPPVYTGSGGPSYPRTQTFATAS